MKECDIDWTERFSELKQSDYSGLKRYFCYSLSESQDIEPAVNAMQKMKDELD